MYEAANEKINEGLGLGARIFIGAIAGLFGIFMVLAGMGPERSLGSIVFGAFCLMIAIVCATRGRVRQFFGSFIGTVIFLVGIAYLVHELKAGPLVSDSRAKPSAVNAILYLVFIGIPGATYAWKARFGFPRKPDPVSTPQEQTVRDANIKG